MIHWCVFSNQMGWYAKSQTIGTVLQSEGSYQSLVWLKFDPVYLHSVYLVASWLPFDQENGFLFAASHQYHCPYERSPVMTLQYLVHCWLFTNSPWNFLKITKIALTLTSFFNVHLENHLQESLEYNARCRKMPTSFMKSVWAVLTACRTRRYGFEKIVPVIIVARHIVSRTSIDQGRYTPWTNVSATSIETLILSICLILPTNQYFSQTRTSDPKLTTLTNEHQYQLVLEFVFYDKPRAIYLQHYKLF